VLPALAMEALSRGLLTFNFESKGLFIFCQVGLSNLGSALLGSSITLVALKQLTTTRTRGMAFGIQYAVFLLGGAVADFIGDPIRRRDYQLLGRTFSGVRMIILCSLVAICTEFLFAFFFIHDIEVVNDDDAEPAAGLDDDDTAHGMPPAKLPTHPVERPQISLSSGGDIARNVRAAAGEVKYVLSSTAFWKVITIELFLLGTRMQFSILDSGILGMFLVRRFGEATPIMLIHSINLWGNAFGSPVVGALLSHIPVLGSWLRIIIPGVLLMSLAPSWMLLSPSLWAACAYCAHITMGEIVWAPRKTAWVASIAIKGREGAFLALSKLRNFLSDPINNQINGHIQSTLNPNCRSCRDDLGHFCEHAVVCEGNVGGPLDRTSGGNYTAFCESLALQGLAQGCYSGVPGGKEVLCLNGAGNSSALTRFAPEISAVAAAASHHCPDTCLSCPEYTSQPRAMWLFVLGLAMSSPVLLCLVVRWLDHGAGEAFERMEDGDVDDSDGGLQQPSEDVTIPGVGAPEHECIELLDMPKDKEVTAR